MLSLLLFLPATVFPLLAVSKLAGRVEPSFVVAYVLLICLVTGMAYGWDKYRARSGGRRIPESVLHLLELAGGWPAAFWAQRIFRHKIRKRSYQVGFWMISLVHQCLAIGFLFF